MNKYVLNAIKYKENIISILSNIFKSYNKLILSINDYNLLSDDLNCIKSSTAIGFCLEELIVSNLVKFSNGLVKKCFNPTQRSSFDFYSNINNELFLTNLKVQKKDGNKISQNDAISAINALYKDYVLDNPNVIKHFFILKITYELKNQYIYIIDIDGYFLEEIDFSNGYNSDNRNWSKKFNKNSARLMVSNHFRKNHSISINNISYHNTKQFIEKIYKN